MLIKRISKKDIESATKTLCVDRNLYLRPDKDGSKYWIFRYKLPGQKIRQMSLGPLRDIGMEKAIERARLLRLQVREGIDPQEAKKEAAGLALIERAKRKTFSECAEEWMVRFDPSRSGKRSKTIVNRAQKYVFPLIGDEMIQQFSMDVPTTRPSALIGRVLEPIWFKLPVTAQEVRWMVKAVIQYALDERYIRGSNAVDSFNSLPKIETFYAPTSHESLEYRKIGEFIEGLRAYGDKAQAPLETKSQVHPERWAHCWICDDPRSGEIAKAAGMGAKPRYLSRRFGINYVSLDTHLRCHVGKPAFRPTLGYALEFAILTAVRKGQVHLARWDEIDLDDKIWVCTEHKTKKKVQQDYIIPLSTQAMAVLEAMRIRQEAQGTLSEYVFLRRSGFGHPLGEDALGQFIRKNLAKLRASLNVKNPNFTVHGFRTTFGTWAVEHDWDEDDSELALGHMIGTPVRNIYKRFALKVEQRRPMMQEWADYCDQTRNNVVPFASSKIGGNHV